MRLKLAGLAIVLLAPAAFSQAPPKPEYRKLKITQFYCQSPKPDSSRPSGCLSPTEPGMVVWDFPDCRWPLREYDPASCTIKATPNASGVFGDVAVSCTEKKFEKPARECVRTHRLQDQFKGDLTPVCLTFDYAKRDRKTAVGRGMIPPLGPAIRELASCPAPVAQ